MIELDWLTTMFGCRHGSSPSTYLGVPLGGNAKTFLFWQPVFEKIHHKLHSWKYAFISKGGLHTLIHATLSNVPTYYPSLFKLPSKVAKREGSRGDGGMHNIN